MTLAVFDIDGTLTKTKSIDEQCFLESIRECWDCSLTEVDWGAYPNVTDTGLAKDIYRELFNKEISEPELKKLKEVFCLKIYSAAKTKSQDFTEVKGATYFIEELKKQKIDISIATGGWKDTAACKLKLINIDISDFPYATSDDHDSRKKILLKSIQQAINFYKKNFTNIYYIGDGVWDYKTANELKVGFVGIDYNNTGSLKKLGAECVYNDFTDTTSIIHVLTGSKGI